MLYSDCVSYIFNVYFLTILPCSTFEWQIKPARITLSSTNKITIVIIPSQSMESKYVDLKTFFQYCKLTTFLHDYFDRKTYEQFKSSKSWHQTEQTTEENVETEWLFQQRPTSCFKYITKNRWIVRSGIRTHAYQGRLRPELSALDRSAILTCAWP